MVDTARTHHSRPRGLLVRAPILLTFLALAALPAGARAATPDTLTVVTLNLWHDQRDWPKRLAVILAEMRALRPDVLCLQEVLQHPALRNQAETLADSLGYAMHFTSVDSVHREKRYGNAILTPHRVLHAGGKNLAPADDYRTVAHVRIDVRGRVVDAYDTHLHHTREGGSIRATQIRDLLAFIDSTRGAGAVVLAGDFNAELGTPEMDLVTRDYLSAFKAMHVSATREQAATFNPLFGVDPGAIDHIFVSKSARPRLVPRACEILFRSVGSDSVWASDHFGVATRLEVVEGK
jgi:endonuclease/exonuclease/phosphatase family metal-dependent hydrolase